MLSARYPYAAVLAFSSLLFALGVFGTARTRRSMSLQSMLAALVSDSVTTPSDTDRYDNISAVLGAATPAVPDLHVAVCTGSGSPVAWHHRW